MKRAESCFIWTWPQLVAFYTNMSATVNSVNPSWQFLMVKKLNKKKKKTNNGSNQTKLPYEEQIKKCRTLNPGYLLLQSQLGIIKLISDSFKAHHIKQLQMSSGFSLLGTGQTFSESQRHTSMRRTMAWTETPTAEVFGTSTPLWQPPLESAPDDALNKSAQRKNCKDFEKRRQLM